MSTPLDRMRKLTRERQPCGAWTLHGFVEAVASPCLSEEIDGRHGGVSPAKTGSQCHCREKWPVEFWDVSRYVLVSAIAGR